MVLIVLTSTSNNSAIRFCDIQNVSLLKMTSILVSPCEVLYGNMLELSEFCISSVVETVLLKYSLARITDIFRLSAFSTIIIHAIRERW